MSGEPLTPEERSHALGLRVAIDHEKERADALRAALIEVRPWVVGKGRSQIVDVALAADDAMRSS